ncbi:MAG: ABC transporter permease [Acidobacteria bacterium]|nr:ABC transporter permease [Acidobacteriota bacterium]
MVNRLILANLLMRPVRSVLSITAVAVEVLLIILVVGLTHGMLEETAQRTRGVGADIMVQPQTTSFLLGLSGSPMPIQIADRLRELSQVRAVAPVMVQASSSNGVTLIYGIERQSFDQVSGGFRFIEGRYLEAPDEILVDDIYSRANQVRSGQTISLLNQNLRVAGVVERGKGARIFMRLDALQDLMGSLGKVSVFFVKAASSSQLVPALEQIRQVLPNYQVRDMEEYTSLMTANNLPGLNNFITVMIGLAVAIGLLVIFVTMYSTMVERTREIGILKSMGASKRYVMSIVLRETAFLTLLGAGLGIALSYLFRSLVGIVFPTLLILITGEWILRACLIALAASFVGASYPAFRASLQDPIEALAYE